MQNDECIKNINIINTSLGQINYEILNEQNIILCNEHIYQILVSQKQGQTNNEQILLQNLFITQTNPQTNQSNLILNSIDEQIQIYNDYNQNNQNQKIQLIIDTTHTNNQQNINQLKIFSQKTSIPICFGFSFNKQININQKQETKIAITEDLLYQQIYYELSLNKENIFPAFLGPIFIEESNNYEDTFVEIKSYCKSVIEFEIPLFIQFNFFNDKSTSKLYQLLDILTAEGIPKQKIIILNFPIQVLKLSSDLQLNKQIGNFQEINDLLNQDYFLIFDVLDSVNEIDILELLIEHICSNNQYHHIAISNGIKFKMHLSQYGGPGLFYFNQFYQKLQQNEKVKNYLKFIMFKNIIEKLNWTTKKINLPIQYKKWICPQCEKEYNDITLEKFKKLGKEFCSLQCVKTFMNSKN